MATFTHWRFRAWMGTSSAYMQLGEVTLLSSGGTDLSVGGTATASSEYSGSFLAGNAFDKNNATEWATNGTDIDPWVQYAVASPIDVAQLSVRFASSASYRPVAIRLDAANSGSGPWTKMVLAGAFPLEGTTRVYDVSQSEQNGVEYHLSHSAQLYPPVSFSPLAALEYKLGLSRDYTHGGLGYIYGNVRQDHDPVDLPLARRVRLHREVDSVALRETWSDAAGYYVFYDVNPDYTYFTMAHDHTGSYRDVVANGLIPDPMP